MDEYSSDRVANATPPLLLLSLTLVSPLDSLLFSPMDRGEKSGEVHLAKCGNERCIHTYRQVPTDAGTVF
ncbi:MAG: hypothetical protein ACKOI2_07445 [Actinomycetota bacterium]